MIKMSEAEIIERLERIEKNTKRIMEALDDIKRRVDQIYNELP